MTVIFSDEFYHSVSGITTAVVQALEEAGLHRAATEANSRMISAGSFSEARRIASNYVEVVD